MQYIGTLRLPRIICRLLHTVQAALLKTLQYLDQFLGCRRVLRTGAIIAVIVVLGRVEIVGQFRSILDHLPRFVLFRFFCSPREQTVLPAICFVRPFAGKENLAEREQKHNKDIKKPNQ